jgi:hypothetical protein
MLPFLRRALVGLIGRTEPIPYVISFPAPAGFSLTAIKVDDFPGLMYVQVVPDGIGQRLLSFWRDSQAYAGSAGPFTAQVGGALGTHIPVQGPGLPKWQFDPSKTFGCLLALLAGAAAVLSQFDVVRKPFASPEAYVSGQGHPLDVREDQKFDAEFQARNSHSFAPCDLRLEDPIFTPVGESPRDGLKLHHLNVPPLTNIGPGDSRAVKVYGIARKPGKYDVVVRGKASAGWAGHKDVVSDRQRVKVWKTFELLGDREVSPLDEGRSCEVTFRLRAGQSFAYGVELEFLLEEKGVWFNYAKIQGVREDNKSYVEGVTNITCKTPALAEFREYRLTLGLESTMKREASEWERLGKEIKPSEEVYLKTK